ncbi:MAG: 3-ketoacyl-ACP reductase [Thiotrichales bacterium SG8_50]|nr:MAG: 3-ketoacyl-ACP reductase [Thiotrichales bacterium SG8_50]
MARAQSSFPTRTVRALVTGGSGGIGAAICRRLAHSGMHVVVHANRRPEEARELVKELGAAGANAEFVQFDVTDSTAASVALERLLAAGPIQVLINNAGVHDDAPLAGMRPEQLLPMIRTRWGRIVSVSSIAGIMGNRGQANYAAAKSGLHGASKSLAIEVASRGITVNVVAPGIIETPMSAQTFPPEEISRIVPMQRAGTPEEVAALTAFLASNEAAYITGQVISVNGGMA